MEKPYRFFAIHNATKEIRYFDCMLLKPYDFYGVPYPWTIYEDTRYAAKIRLWRYVTKTPKPVYQPYAGTEIGRTVPILNF